jgi:hypothetical protein
VIPINLAVINRLPKVLDKVMNILYLGRMSWPTEDPMVLAYLTFLEKDIVANPQRLSPLARHSEIDKLLADVEVDFDLDLKNEEASAIDK